VKPVCSQDERLRRTARLFCFFWLICLWPDLSAASRVERGNDPTGPSLPSGGGLSLPTFAVVDLGANSRLLDLGYVPSDPASSSDPRGAVSNLSVRRPLETLTADGFMAFGEYSGDHFWQSSTYSETRYLWNWTEGIVAQTTHSRPSWSINPQPFPFYFTAPLGYGGVFYGSNAPLRYTVSDSWYDVGPGQFAALLEVDPYLSPASTSHHFALPENAPEKGARATDFRAGFTRHWESSYENLNP